MNGKEIEKLIAIDKFIMDFEKKYPEMKAKMNVDNNLVFSVDFKYGYSEQDQLQELLFIEKAYVEHFNETLKDRVLIRLGNNNDLKKLDYFYTYKTK